ncbi:MAG: hypothetical protein JEY99_09855 [Spirochaetales bacterium]|nr:hypothetical protein [Spirochaetales bacterium]
MIKQLVEKAHQGEPVYINRVRAVFASLPTDERCEINAHLLQMDGVSNRCFTFYIPRNWDAEGVDHLIGDYLSGEVYNILSTLGGRKITFYCDVQNTQVVTKMEDLIRSFDLDLPRGKRQGYGRSINVIDRMLSAMEGRDSSFLMEIKDLTALPVIEDNLESLDVKEGVFSRLVPALAHKRVLGIDVGGTDIKLALVGEGKILCMKEYDWFPALFKESRELVNPIVLLTRLLSVWQGVHLSTTEIPGEKLALLDAAMQQDAGDELILRTCESLENYIEDKESRFDGIGLCFPDVVVNDKVVGGEVYKTRGIRLNPEINYEEDFKQLTDLNLALSPFCLYPDGVSFTNDGPMAAFTAAVEWAASGDSDLLDRGFFAHTLGTELGTGWVREDGSIPDLPLEVYNCIIDLGSYPEREYKADDLRSVNNFNTNLPGTLQKYASQSGVFRLALKYFPEQRPDLYEELKGKGFVVKGEGGDMLVVPSENPDLRKPFLEHMMALLERENDEVNNRIWNDIGESLGVTFEETERLLHPKSKKRILFGRLVKRAACYKAMETGAQTVVPDIEFEVADASIAFTPLMKQLEADKTFTVAQFAQAVGAVYFAVDGLIRKSIIQEEER